MASLGSEVVLFGGNDLTQVYGDTWRWDGSTWSAQGTAVEPRNAYVMTGVGGALVRFGGTGVDAFAVDTTDTWLFVSGSWTSQALMGPAGRWFSAMTPSP